MEITQNIYTVVQHAAKLKKTNSYMTIKSLSVAAFFLKNKANNSKSYSDRPYLALAPRNPVTSIE